MIDLYKIRSSIPKKKELDLELYTRRGSIVHIARLDGVSDFDKYSGTLCGEYLFVKDGDCFYFSKNPEVKVFKKADISKVSKINDFSFPCHIGPDIGGLRCLIHRKNRKTVIQTTGNQMFEVSNTNITHAMGPGFFKSFVADCQILLTVSGKWVVDFQNFSSICKSRKTKFIIFVNDVLNIDNRDISKEPAYYREKLTYLIGSKVHSSFLYEIFDERDLLDYISRSKFGAHIVRFSGDSYEMGWKIYDGGETLK